MPGLTPVLSLDVVTMTAAPSSANPYPVNPLQTQLRILYSMGNQNTLLFLVF